MEEVETLEINDKKPIKKKKLKLWVKLLLIIIVILLIIIMPYYLFIKGPKNSKDIVKIKISSGVAVYNVGKKLKKEGVIKSYLAYKLYVKLNNINSYKAGVYKLDKSDNLFKIVNSLNGDKHRESDINITFKEGKTIRRVAQQIAKNTNITEDEFYKKIADESYIDSLISKYWFLTDDIKNKDIYYSLEGYLYPDTYTFDSEVKIEEIIKTMLDNTDKVFSSYKDNITASKYSIHQLVTLASIVEQEGRTAEDRKEIAGVFYNRLNKNISLGSDVTTYYGLKIEMGERSLTASEYNTINAYNTRPISIGGKLPVGPICNFGKSSFEAVINPNITDNMYFVADKYGKVYFTKTNSEHEALVNKLKKEGNWGE